MPAEMALQVGWPAGLFFGLLAAALALALERWAGRTRRGVLLRLSVVLLVAAAAARPTLEWGADVGAVWVVDEAVASSAAASPLGAPGAEDRVVIRYGGPDGLGLASAIDLARRAAPRGGRLLVVGSGAALGREPEMAAARARASGWVVDVLVTEPAGPDAAVTVVEAPAAWRTGAPVPIAVGVRADRPLTATLEVAALGRIVDRETLQLPPGGRQATHHLRLDPRGATSLDIVAEVRVAGDAEPRNDRAAVAVTIAPPPSVLVVGRDEGAILLADVLAAGGARTEVREPSALPSRLSELEPYDVLALVDVSAEDLGHDQMAAVEEMARRMGRGVLFTAGRQSFAAGGWEATPLAALAPVGLDPPERDTREAVAFLLMIDQSASMGTVEGRASLSKLDLAREAAARSAEVLHPGDAVGVIAYDEQARWLVPLREVGEDGDLSAVEAALRDLEASGGTRLAAALQLGLPALTGLETPTRHAVLISDGRDFAPDVAGTEGIVRDARSSGVTLSTIAIGFDADRELLQGLARLGRGRYHEADQPSELPRLAVEESKILRARGEQTGAFSVTAGDVHPLLSGVDVGLLPPVSGYVAVRTRPGAATVLAAPGGDPLLATWNYGLGRVAAWMSDAGESWAWDWPDDAEARRLLRRVADYLAPAPLAGPPGASVETAGDRARLEVDARDGLGLPLDLADVRLAITRTGMTTVAAVPQTAPGLYALEMSLPEAPAVGRVQVDGGDEDQGVVVSLARQAAEGLRPTSDGAGRLAALAAAGGGKVVERPPADRAARRSLSLWPWLLALAAVLWPVDVADQLGYRLSPRGIAGDIRRRPQRSDRPARGA